MIKYFKNIKYNRLYKKKSYSKIIKYNTYKNICVTENIFESLTSIDACLKYKNKKILLLNFASPYFPGGGYKLGFKTQEESLCYASSLYGEISKFSNRKFYFKNLIKLFNPLYESEAILSKNVTIFRNDNFALINPFCIDVITIAPPNNYSAKLIPWISEKMITDALNKKISLINYVINQNDYDIIILGAFGCGAFGNTVEIVAKIFKETIHTSATCVYAIPNKKMLDKFKEIFKNN